MADQGCNLGPLLFHWTSHKKVLLIYMILLVLLGIRSAKSCGVFKKNIGKTTPDMIVPEGGTMEINCTLNADTTVINNETVALSSTMLFFKHTGSRIPNSKVSLVDDKTLQYKVRRTSPKDSGLYFCFIDLGQRDPKVKLICPTIVKIANPPRDIPKDDFHCLGENFKRMVCSWELPNYRVPTDATLHLLIGGNISYVECPERVNKSSCAFSTRHKPPYRIGERTLRFALESNNSLGNHWQVFEIDHYSHVVSGPPQRLNITAVTSSSANLEWKHPKRIEDDVSLQEMVVYYVELSSSVDDPITFNTTKTFATVENLIPFTIYSVQVRSAIRTAFERGLQSEPLTMNFTTIAAVPYLSPEIPEGGFMNIKKMDGTREVILYYSSIKKRDRYGPDFYYLISVKPPLSTKELVREPDSFNVRLTGLRQDSEYEIAIISRNAEGTPNRASKVKIPSLNQSLPAVHDVFAIDKGQGSYTVGWITSDTNSNETVVYNVYSCITRPPDPTCISSLISVNRSYDSSISLNLPENYTYNFAVAPVMRTLSPGLTWASCIEKTNNDHQKDRFKKFEIISLGAYSVMVTWDLDCGALYSFIEYFEVRYCKIDSKECSKSERINKAKRATNELVIEQLDSNSLYSFKIYAYTKQRQVLESIRKTGQTKIDKLVAITIGLVIIMLIICSLMALYALFLRILRKRKEQSELDNAVKSYIPKVPSKLKGDPGILLNTLSQGSNLLTNQYENKEYMNASDNVDHQLEAITTEIDENARRNNGNALSSTNDNQRRGLVVKQGSQSNSKQNLFNSSNSGYETKNSDVYGKQGSYTLSGIIDTASEDNPYACIDDASSLGSLSDSDNTPRIRSEEYVSRNYVPPSDSYIIV